MFTLKGPVDADAKTDLDDSATIKFALNALGYYDDSDTGLAPYTDNQLFTSIKSFQKDNGLTVDGIIKADGPTQAKMKEKLSETSEALGAFKDFTKNFLDMRAADTIDADKYFHCKANFEATKRGWKGHQTAIDLSHDRERYGQNVKKDPEWDMKADDKANRHGRRSAYMNEYSTAEEACAIFRPKGLDEKY